MSAKQRIPKAKGAEVHTIETLSEEKDDQGRVIYQESRHTFTTYAANGRVNTQTALVRVHGGPPSPEQIESVCKLIEEAAYRAIVKAGGLKKWEAERRRRLHEPPNRSPGEE